MPEPAWVLLVTVGLLSTYLIGIGGATAAALRVRETWRRRTIDRTTLQPSSRDVTLDAPTLPRSARVLRAIGWAAFLPSLGLAMFANPDYPWVALVALLLTVALNGFHFTAMQNMGDTLTLTRDTFRLGPAGRERVIRWVHVTEFTGARIGNFSASKMAENGDWQDPKLRPNVIFFRLNRALVATPRTLVQRLTGFSYYDGLIRNMYGLSTEQLITVLRTWRAAAADSPMAWSRRPDSEPGPIIGG